MDEDIANFVAITGAPENRATQFLQLSDGNLESAIQLFFESPELAPAATQPAPPPASSRPAAASSRISQEDDEGVVHIPSDDEVDDDFDMTEDPPERQPRAQAHADVDADAEMARRLQEEFYGSGSGGGAVDVDPDGYRAPIQRTTETLVGPDADWGTDPDDVRSAVAQQMRMREQVRRARPGIFNQRDTSGIWNQASAESAEEVHQRALALATGGASRASSKQNMLAELFRPPFDIMYHGSWESARDRGKDEQKWLLVNVQDSSIFDCQALNRDIWKDDGIKETVKESFIFMQYSKDDPAGQEYVQYYFQMHESADAYPHIAIVDPRTGEQVKIWSGHKAIPKAPEFLMQLHEFLDRYSLKANARNPVAKRKAEPKKQLDVSRMSEEEMLQMAMQNSLDNNGGEGPTADDPDDLTKSDILTRDKGTAPAGTVDSGIGGSPDSVPKDGDLNGTSSKSSLPFAQISSTNPHIEPPHDPAKTTRIQFKHPAGRIVHRFAVDDEVRRIYEWLKADPIEGREGQDFELVNMGKNLIDSLDNTVGGAGLKNSTVMVEFTSGADEEE